MIYSMVEQEMTIFREKVEMTPMYLVEVMELTGYVI